MGALTLIVLTVGGVVIAGGVMAACAQLAGIEQPGMRNCVIAAAGFGLPLAAAAGMLMGSGTAAAGLFLTPVAIVVGVAVIRIAFSATLGQAVMVWVMNVSAWVILTSLVIRMRGHA